MHENGKVLCDLRWEQDWERILQLVLCHAGHMQLRMNICFKLRKTESEESLMCKLNVDTVMTKHNL